MWAWDQVLSSAGRGTAGSSQRRKREMRKPFSNPVGRNQREGENILAVFKCTVQSILHLKKQLNW
jgi:hypothetical protein